MNNLCALCGDNLATTMDHIPPRGIYPKPRPNDIATTEITIDAIRKWPQNVSKKFFSICTRLYINNLQIRLGKIKI